MTFFGLRSYSTTPQLWGGTRGLSAACDAGDHAWGEVQRSRRRGQAAGDTASVGNTQKRVCPPEIEQGTTCARCGCWRGELGSEPTLRQWVMNLVEVFAGVKRVLRDDGLLWVECGSSYASGQDELAARNETLAPFHLAMGLQQAGWTLRQVISLCKTAPMPESIGGTEWRRCRVKVAGGTVARRGDPAAAGGWPEHGETIWDGTTAQWQDCPGCARCRETDGYVQSWGSGRATCATSYLFQFCKDGARYYYDAVAARQEATHGYSLGTNGASGLFGWRRAAAVGDGRENPGGERGSRHCPEAGRNRLNFQPWRPEPSGLSHYAMFPPGIPKLAIDTAPLYVCPECAAPLARVVEGPSMVGRDGPMASGWREPGGAHTADRRVGWSGKEPCGWRPTCTHAYVTPQTAARATILDCFGGAGTSALVADRLGRDGISIELNPEYHALAEQRLREDAPLLAEVEAMEVSAP